MSMSELLGPLRPYMVLLKVGASVVIVSSAFVGGCRHGREVEQARHEAEVAQWRATRSELTHQLEAAAGALRAQADAVAEAIENEKKLTRAAEVAAQVHANEAARLRREANNYQALLLGVRQARPTCAALLDTDLKKECGL
jgi:hypothetical protein